MSKSVSTVRDEDILSHIAIPSTQPLSEVQERIARGRQGLSNYLNIALTTSRNAYNRDTFFEILISGYEHAMEYASQGGDMEAVQLVNNNILLLLSDYNLSDMTSDITKSLIFAAKNNFSDIFEELKRYLGGGYYKIDENLLRITIESESNPEIKQMLLSV